MAIRHSCVTNYLKSIYVDKRRPGGRWADWHTSGVEWNPTFAQNHSSVDDTYIIIFGPSQHKELEFFMEFVKTQPVKILFKSEKAYNYNSNDDPRNTLVIFELEKPLV